MLSIKKEDILKPHWKSNIFVILTGKLQLVDSTSTVKI